MFKRAMVRGLLAASAFHPKAICRPQREKQHDMKHLLGFLIALVVMPAGVNPGNAKAATVSSWNGAVGANWTSATAWTPTGVPAASDQVSIASGLAITTSQYPISVSNGGSITLSGVSTGLGQQQSPSSWLAPDFYVGQTGNGEVLVEGGASLVTMATELGRTSGAVGQVTLQGSGTTWAVGVTDFEIGKTGGQGIVNVENNASINYFSGMDIGYGGTGTVNINHATVNVGDFSISDGGQGTLNVSNSGIATAEASYVGYYSNTVGKVTVDGAGSSLTNVGQGQGYFVVGRYGTGTVTVSNGGLIHNSANLIVADNGGNGMVNVVGPNSQIGNNGSLMVGASLTTGGTAQVSLASGGLMSSTGGVVLLPTSELVITADGLGGGLLSTDGTADLGGSLEFDFAEGFSPTPGMTYNFITARSISGQFAHFTSNYSPSVELVYGSNTVSVQVIPEPSTLTLSGSVLLGLGVVYLRRRRAKA